MRYPNGLRGANVLPGKPTRGQARRCDIERVVQTADGRTLAVTESGDLDGQPVLVQVGTPASRHLWGPAVADATARGLRLISYDRPGFGGSSPQPGRTVADCAADVRTVCAALGIGRVPMWGSSGGGPHALACAALLPGLVTAAATLASVAPFDADGLDWFDGMPQEDLDYWTGLGGADEDAARAVVETERGALLTLPPGEMAATWADPALTASERAEFLAGASLEAHSMQEAIAPGAQGLWDEERAMVSPWGFEVTRISVPVLLLHGTLDRSVPFGHGQWLAAHIPGVEARLLDGEDHRLSKRHIGEVHAWLLDHR